MQANDGKRLPLDVWGLYAPVGGSFTRVGHLPAVLF